MSGWWFLTAGPRPGGPVAAVDRARLGGGDGPTATPICVPMAGGPQ